MGLFKKVVTLFSLLALIMSCNTKLFVNKHYVVEQANGVAVFIDKESRKFRNMESDVFIDSLIPDFFIPYNFFKGVIKKEDIDKAILSKSEHSISFFYIIRDCNEENRKSAIEHDCTTLFLDKNIDDYLHSKKIYVQPVKIDFLRSNINRNYYELHKGQIIEYKGKQIKLMFNKGSYEILRMDVLEYNWE